MPYSWRLATGNWSASKGRTLASVLSVALGVGAVVTITNFYETSHRAILDEVITRWMGSAHITVFPPGAHWGTLQASLADTIAELDHVRHVTARLRRRVRLVKVDETNPLIESGWWRGDAIGINPETERPFLSVPNLTGRMMEPGERGLIVIERGTARMWKLGLGDSVALISSESDSRMTLQVVGIFDSQRIAEFQAPNAYLALADLQSFGNEPGAVSAIDVMLDDPTPAIFKLTKEAIERRLGELSTPYSPRIETAEGRQIAIAEAERITQLILTVIAFVAMLTSFFVIVTTQGMSLLQRRPQFGIMRCVGATRGQLAGALLAELIPLGLVGTVAGILGGMAVTRIMVGATSEVFFTVPLSSWGVILAASSGIVTTLLSALLLLAQVGRVSPLEAVNPQAQPARMYLVYLAGGFGVALLAIHHLMVTTPDVHLWLTGFFAMAGVGTLHIGYALLAPAVVVTVGRPIAGSIGRLLGLCRSLAEEPFVRAPWRSTGACWVLMVGVSLIVYIAIRAEGVLAIWDFPGRLPETFVWTSKYVSGDVLERVRGLPGVATSTAVTDVNCEITPLKDTPASLAGSVMEALIQKLSRPVFVAGDTEQQLRMIKVTFREGNERDAGEKLERGGYVLIPTQTAKNKDLHLGDKVAVKIRGKSSTFEVAGVIESPALDLAVSAFQATSYMQFAAANAVIGTRKDLKEKFGLDFFSMLLCDIDLPPADVPAGFDPDHPPDITSDAAMARAVLSWADHLPNERDTINRIGGPLRAWLDSATDTPAPRKVRTELRRFAQAIRPFVWSQRHRQVTREENWEVFRERLVLLKIVQVIDRPNAIKGSLVRFKRAFDDSLRRAIVAITWLPSLLLVVAAVGIGNLMMVSVQVRSRQIGILRAVGAVKSQIIRLVFAEAATLGILGSVMGVALGIHEAYSVNRITSEMLNLTLEFIVPIPTVVLSVALTVTVCVLSAVGPARHAAGNNIMDAIQQ